MAKATTGFREILTNIKKKQFANIYILMGEEPYYLDILANALEENVVEPEDRDFNATSYYGQEIDIATVIATAQQFPIMANRRIVMVKEAQAMDRSKVQLDNLAEYVLRPNAQTVLVVVYKGDTLASTSKLLKAASKVDSVVFNSPRLRDYELATPVKDYCQSKKVAIDEMSVKLLCEYVGSDLGKLFGEIDKLMVAGGPKMNAITAEMIEKNIGISKDYNNFELQNALIMKNYDKAIRIVEYFKKNSTKNPTVMTSALLYKFFSNLVIAHLLPDKSDSSLAAALNVKNSYALRDYRTAMGNYTLSQAVGAIHALREFDTKSKGINSMQKEHDLLRELVYRVFTVR